MVMAVVLALVVVLPASALADPPTITSMPDLAGRSVAPGDVLDGTAMASGGATISYQWVQCDPSPPATCTPIASETNPTYTASALDLGFQLAVQVTADNGEPPAAFQESGHTATVANHTAPSIDSGPTISGSAVVGQTLTASATASGNPAPSVSYAWSRCDAAGLNCAAIPGATSGTYDVVADDAAGTLRVTATATNGTPPDATATSAPTAAVTAPPHIDSGPQISGTPAVGSTLAATASASGTPAPTVTYAWQRCDAAGAGCTAIGSATSPTYKVVAGDAGHTLKVIATATNGTPPDASAPSSATAVVPTPEAPPAQTASSATPATPATPATTFDQTPWIRQETTPGPPEPGPFPQIRMRGRLLALGGARITYLAVLAAPGWTVTVDCGGGRGCPARHTVLTTKSSTTRLRAFERVLRPGVRLVFRVTRAEVKGKYSSFTIRAHSAPKRRDLCLAPGSTKAVSCSTT
jgi:hypothetical protein